MSGEMRPIPWRRLLRSIQTEFQENHSVFGIPETLFYRPRPAAPYATTLFGHPLATPVGPAAGPHTQLTQNIVASWLSGARFIELKTVQVMDRLEIPRPCIDLADEGYNVEWSQELPLETSAEEYLKAWVLVHVLPRLLGFDARPTLGTIFNLSVGYNLEGVKSPPMTRFLDRLSDASTEIAQLLAVLRRDAPSLADLEIPSRVSDNVTLSTMHGCPPEEIERIARYLLEQRGLHTTVKLNPTLLGREAVLSILHDALGFRELEIPEAVFEHDLSYPRAVELLHSLQRVAAGRGLAFGVKLSNTLALRNHRGVLPGEEMYLSGRALYPVTMTLFRDLERDFEGRLPVSFSAGADAENVATILACGALPVTMASSLLKPGGYSRLLQVLEKLEEEMRARDVASLEALAADRMQTLVRAASAARTEPRYQKAYHAFPLPKVSSSLSFFDCVVAPCVEACPIRQDVPEYVRRIAEGEDAAALEAILGQNPLPGVTGSICPHGCESRCTRNNYDEPVAIRALKRFAAELTERESRRPPSAARRVAVVGGGPSGLAAASLLARSGIEVTVYEARDVLGGMAALAPKFRLPSPVLEADVERVRRLGVTFIPSHSISGPPEGLLREGFHAVYVAVGFPREADLELEGADGPGVLGALDLLSCVARGARPDLGHHILVIGGGNTAIDAARTARRLSGEPVTVAYRRTRAEMPAEEEEVAELLLEGNALLELVSPIRAVRREGRLVAVECVRNELGPLDTGGRRRPVPIAGSRFSIETDSLILAVGQRADEALLRTSGLPVRSDGSIAAEPETGATVLPGVFAGGDAVTGPATVVEACAQGQRVARAICRHLGVPVASPPQPPSPLSEEEVLHVRRARARLEARRGPKRLPAAARQGFDRVERTLSPDEARREAARCLQCSDLCDKCIEVCPNRANVAYRVTPMTLRVPILSAPQGTVSQIGEEALLVRQGRQIVHVGDLCNECGNCATFCVHEGKPYRDKPRLFLDEERFGVEADNAFFIDGETIRRREGGEEIRLTLSADRILLEDPRLRVSLSPDLGILEATAKSPFAAPLSLERAAQALVLFRGIRGSARFLLE